MTGDDLHNIDPETGREKVARKIAKDTARAGRQAAKQQQDTDELKAGKEVERDAAERADLTPERATEEKDSHVSASGQTAPPRGSEERDRSAFSTSFPEGGFIILSKLRGMGTGLTADDLALVVENPELQREIRHAIGPWNGTQFRYYRGVRGRPDLQPEEDRRRRLAMMRDFTDTIPPGTQWVNAILAECYGVNKRQMETFLAAARKWADENPAPLGHRHHGASTIRGGSVRVKDDDDYGPRQPPIMSPEQTAAAEAAERAERATRRTMTERTDDPSHRGIRSVTDRRDP